MAPGGGASQGKGGRERDASSCFQPQPLAPAARAPVWQLRAPEPSCCGGEGVHGEGGCVMGTGVLGDSQSLSRKIALGKKGLERSTMTAAKRPVRGRIHRLMTGF